MRGRIGVLPFLFFALSLLMGSSALAEGPGLRNGNLVVHPRLSVSGGYDSNFWRESRLDASAPANPVTVTKFGGGIGLRNRNANRAGISLDLDVLGRYVSAENAEETASLLDESAGLETAKAGLSFAILPNKPVSLELKAKARYSEQPGVEMLKEDGYDRLIASFGPDIRFSPGGRPGSRALELRLGYRFAIERTVGPNANLGGSRGDKDTQQIRLLSRWKFFPKTALLLDFRYWMVDYRRGVDLDIDGNQVDSPNKDLSPLRAELGLEGLITPRMAMTIRGGYSNSFHETGESYSGPVARVNVDYRIEPRLKFGLGYSLKVGDDSFSNYYTLNRAHAQATVNLPGHVSINGRFGVDYYSYSRDGAPAWTASLPERTEPILRAKTTIGWEPVTWMTVRASWEFENNRSKYYFCLGENPGRCFDGDPIDLAEYTRHVVTLSVASEY
jgi:hypothetical protein